MKIHKKNFIPVCVIFLCIVFNTVCANKANAVAINVVNPISTADFAKIVENVLLWILSVAGSLAIFAFIVGGIMYMTSSGDEQKANNAKKVITWTIIGTVLILASYAIIVVIDAIFTK